LKALRKIGCPAIALTRRKVNGEYNHYVLILGFDGPQVKVADPPLRPKVLPVKEMEHLFEGTVLILSESPIVLPRSYHYIGIPFLVVGTVIFALCRIRAGKNIKTRVG
jgi:ABC-type bacteriocin/lantibiotic exporter with double-glycine peptidase domain